MFTIFKVQAISHFLKQKKNSSRDLRYNATPWQKKKKNREQTQRHEHSRPNYCIPNEIEVLEFSL